MKEKDSNTCARRSDGTERQIFFSAPANVTYRINVYKGTCGNPVLYATYDVSGNSAGFAIYNQGSFDYWVEIKYVSGASCSSWALDIDSLNCSCI